MGGGSVTPRREVVGVFACMAILIAMGFALGAGYQRAKPRNGECPVCGTTAAAWHNPVPEVGPNGSFRMDEWRKWEPSGVRRVDCTHCGCTFKQEAEKA